MSRTKSTRLHRVKCFAHKGKCQGPLPRQRVAVQKIEHAVEEIVEELGNQYESELPATAIGEAVMEQLRKLDEVAYVRFASVYRQFRDINEFVHAIHELKS